MKHPITLSENFRFNILLRCLNDSYSMLHYCYKTANLHHTRICFKTEGKNCTAKKMLALASSKNALHLCTYGILVSIIGHTLNSVISSLSWSCLHTVVNQCMQHQLS